jgi:hypothetical protein
MHDYIKYFLLVLTGLISFVLVQYPAKYWLPFAAEFPPWLTETPLTWILMRSFPVIAAAVLLVAFGVIAKEVYARI